MVVFDFFADIDLARPQVTPAEAESIAAALYGIGCHASELGSNQDRNFRIDPTDTRAGGPYVLKVHNPAFSAAELAVQDAAMEQLSSRGLSVPVLLPGSDGTVAQQWSRGGEVFSVRLLTYLDGPPLASLPQFEEDTVAGLGRLSGEVASQLADLTAPGLDRVLQWDLRQAARVVDRLSPSIPDPVRRDLVRAATATAVSRLDAVRAELRVQPIHGDITDDNVLARPGSATPYAVLDLGDLAEGWLVAELATTVTSLLAHVSAGPSGVLPAVRAFHQAAPLSDADVVALWPLVVLRAAALVASGQHQVQLEEHHTYAEEHTENEWLVFERATSTGFDEALDAFRSALGTTAPYDRAPILGPLAAGDVEVLDLSVTSPALDQGRWLEEDVEWDVAREVLGRVSVAAAAFGERRLTRAVPHATEEVPVVSRCWELFVRAGELVHAPYAGEVTVAEHDRLVLSGGGVHLALGGLAPSAGAVAGHRVAAGSPVGEVLAERGQHGRLVVQRLTGPHQTAPAFVTASSGRSGSPHVLDPGPLIGLRPVPSRFGAQVELERRSRVFASAQERYYADPPQIERGWKQFLVDTDARVYVDMVNNVSSIGHAHPRQVEAVSRQMALLNTNSRFLYRALADLSERLVAMAPDPSLDTVLLVNSGTEAVDLALRLAQVHTGRRQVVALREAYHGWSVGADAISTSAFDNPSAMTTRPDWVTVADMPNPYRGQFRGRHSASQYLLDLSGLLEQLVSDGRPPAAFICEPVLGNAGGVLLPDGYLQGVYQLLRGHGGLCIADEVQVGLGRLGHHTWGVQQQGVVPDVVCLAKALGNGYPLGAVITRREIAESLSREGNFFSSAGGSPVSAVAGLAVLDVLRDEGLQENAARVGDHLAERLRELSGRHPVIGAVHGSGLYLGVELVRDRETLEPAAEEAAAVCERLLDLGVVEQPTSERQNVLKIKPPLCLDVASADFFVDALEEALVREGF